MKKLMITVACATAASIVFAEGAAAQTPVEEQPTEGNIATERDAGTLMQEFLSSRPNGGWDRGTNKGKNGIFVVQTGVGQISARPDSKSYNDARARAFDKAMMNAKKNLAIYLENEIETAASFSYVEPPIGDKTADQELAEVIANQPDDSILGKAKTLVNKKLDNLLKKEGYDADAARTQGKAKVDEIKARLATVSAKESYKKMIRDASSTVLSGAQAFYTVEVTKGSRSEIGVVLIWSPKLAEMASSMVTGRPVSGAKPKARVRDQINKDRDVLLTTFGVQQKIDENGEYVLVAFGQSGARSSTSASADMAKDKAAQNARAMIRSFAGETVAYSMSQDQAEETLEFTDESLPDMRDQSAADKFIRTGAAKMKFNGFKGVYSWNARHPISGRMVYGEVVTWKPSDAAIARDVKVKIESSAKDGAVGRRTVPQANASGLDGKTKPTATERVKIANQGDEDAF